MGNIKDMHYTVDELLQILKDNKEINDLVTLQFRDKHNKDFCTVQITSKALALVGDFEVLDFFLALDGLNIIVYITLDI